MAIYGDRAYEHAKPDFHGGPDENWTLETEAVNEKRTVEYRKRYEIFKNKHALQPVAELQNTDSPYTFKEGDTLYPVLTDYFKMNEHTAFLVMMKMLHERINVDLWKAGDSVELTADGVLRGKHKGADFSIADVLKAAGLPAAAAGAAPPAEPAPSPAPSTETTAEESFDYSPGTPDEDVDAGSGYFSPGEPETGAPPPAPEAALPLDPVAAAVVNANNSLRGFVVAESSEVKLRIPGREDVKISGIESDKIVFLVTDSSGGRPVERKIFMPINESKDEILNILDRNIPDTTDPDKIKQEIVKRNNHNLADYVTVENKSVGSGKIVWLNHADKQNCEIKRITWAGNMILMPIFKGAEIEVILPVGASRVVIHKAIEAAIQKKRDELSRTAPSTPTPVSAPASAPVHEPAPPAPPEGPPESAPLNVPDFLERLRKDFAVSGIDFVLLEFQDFERLGIKTPNGAPVSYRTGALIGIEISDSKILVDRFVPAGDLRTDFYCVVNTENADESEKSLYTVQEIIRWARSGTGDPPTGTFFSRD